MDINTALDSCLLEKSHLSACSWSKDKEEHNTHPFYHQDQLLEIVKHPTDMRLEHAEGSHIPQGTQHKEQLLLCFADGILPPSNCGSLSLAGCCNVKEGTHSFSPHHLALCLDWPGPIKAYCRMVPTEFVSHAASNRCEAAASRRRQNSSRHSTKAAGKYFPQCC
ncbi:uncharacterized protein LOC132195871 [Neocloeon triangulifer]|uniref:uncharacterized protein LOC132195871 n=1 Tax=Neocloeon triangulifer TaxID=2078957 RepID=UPI00286F4FC8|nr:uncharacterized protein LOC132195871 [Neocloeon triangulifer]